MMILVILFILCSNSETFEFQYSDQNGNGIVIGTENKYSSYWITPFLKKSCNLTLNDPAKSFKKECWSGNSVVGCGGLTGVINTYFFTFTNSSCDNSLISCLENALDYSDCSYLFADPVIVCISSVILAILLGLVIFYIVIWIKACISKYRKYGGATYDSV